MTIIKFPDAKPQQHKRSPLASTSVLMTTEAHRVPMNVEEIAAAYVAMDDRGKAAESKLMRELKAKAVRTAARIAKSKKFWAAYADRLRFARAALDITEQKVAETMGITLRTYRRWERGSRHRDNAPDSELRFRDKYDISLDWLFGGIEHGPPPRFKPRRVG